jgi:hypothetical protein
MEVRDTSKQVSEQASAFVSRVRALNLLMSSVLWTRLEHDIVNLISLLDNGHYRSNR